MEIFIGTRIYVMGGSLLETGQQVRVVEVFDTEKGEWEEDFRFRKGKKYKSNTFAITDRRNYYFFMNLEPY